MKAGTTLVIGILVAASAGIVLAAGRPDFASNGEARSDDVASRSAVAQPGVSDREAQVLARRARFSDRLSQALQDRTRPTLVDSPPSRERAVRQAPRNLVRQPTMSVPAPSTGSDQSSRETAAGLADPVNIAAALTRPSDPIDCLAQAIYYEARSESEEGQAAVAEVILNRARSGRYPRAVCDVVYQRNARTCQFSYTCDGSIGRFPVNRRAWANAERIARDVYAGRTATLLPARSVNYHADYVAPGWGRRLERVRQIGAHIFYGAPLSGQTPGAVPTTTPQNSSAGGLVFVRLDALDRAYSAVQGALQPTSSSETRSGSSSALD